MAFDADLRWTGSVPNPIRLSPYYRRRAWGGLLIAAIASGCGGPWKFADHARLAVVTEVSTPQIRRVQTADVIYVRELEFALANPKFYFVKQRRSMVNREWQEGVARMRDDFAAKVYRFWKEMRLGSRLVFLPDGVPPPPGLLIRTVVHEIEASSGTNWSYATLIVEDTVSGEELLFARLELPSASGRFKARRFANFGRWYFANTFAHTQAAHAIASLVRDGSLPHPGVGRHTRWLQGQAEAHIAEASYWSIYATKPDLSAEARALYKTHATETRAARDKLLGTLFEGSPLCRTRGLSSRACLCSEKRRLGMALSAYDQTFEECSVP